MFYIKIMTLLFTLFILSYGLCERSFHLDRSLSVPPVGQWLINPSAFVYLRVLFLHYECLVLCATTTGSPGFAARAATMLAEAP